MGLEPFEVRFFFFEKNVLNSTNGQENHQTSLKIFLRTIHSCFFNDMTEDFFFRAKSHMGVPLESFFFTQIFFLVTFPGSGRYPNQNSLW